MSKRLFILKKKLPSILKRYGVKRAAVFGSTARGDHRKSSDVDLLVEFKGNKSLLDLIALENELDDKLNIKFDVLTYNSIHPLLRDRILQEQKNIL